MYRISNLQVFCLLIILVGPVAFLEVPKRLISLTFNNAWLVTLAALVPGIFIVFMFNFIIRKSRNPFPLLLEEYFGKVTGKVLAFIYIFVFLLLASYTLSLFVNFVVINVMPELPISVLIGFFLLVSYVIIKNGFENFARLCELIVFMGLPLSFLLVLLATSQTLDLGNLLPFARVKMSTFSIAVISAASVLSRLFPILTIAYFSNYRARILTPLYWTLGFYILLIFTATLTTILVYGSIGSSFLTFPVFSLMRLIKIGDFITNIDIVFIGIWISGIIGTLTIFWFMACFTTQQIFGLKNYTFLAAPTSLIIAVTSLLISPNIVVLELVNDKFIILVYLLFFFIIPFLIFLMALFRPDQAVESSNDANSSSVIM